MKPFILAKREVENYLPQQIWEQVPRSPDRVRSLRRWKRLSEIEKDFIDLEAYFGKIAKSQSAKLGDPQLLPDAPSLESRAGTELRDLLDHMEAWL